MIKGDANFEFDADKLTEMVNGIVDEYVDKLNEEIQIKNPGSAETEVNREKRIIKIYDDTPEGSGDKIIQSTKDILGL